MTEQIRVKNVDAQQIKVANTNIVAEGTVQYDRPQNLTPEQREQARANIKAATGGARRLPKETKEEYGYHDISSYTSITNTFIAPTDGYVLIRKSSGQASVYVDGYTLLAVNNGTGSIFVGQGMPIYVNGSPNAAGFLEWRPEGGE